MDIGVKDGYALSGNKINTIIENVANVINSPSAFVAKTKDIVISDIKSFEIVNNDIYLTIKKPYYIDNRAFRDTDVTNYYDLNDLVTGIGTDVFYNTPIQNLEFKNLNFIDGFYNFRYANQIDTVKFPALKTFSTRGQNVFFQSGLKRLLLDSCERIRGVNFQKANRLQQIYAPNCTAIGGSSFNSIKSGTEITVNQVLETSNDGSPHPELVYAINRGCTVNYV